MPPCHGGGRGFESRPVRKKWVTSTWCPFFFALSRSRLSRDGCESRPVRKKWVTSTWCPFFLPSHGPGSAGTGASPVNYPYGLFLSDPFFYSSHVIILRLQLTFSTLWTIPITRCLISPNFIYQIIIHIIPISLEHSLPVRKVGILLKMFYVYILKSQIDGTYYKGVTMDYLKRLKEHNSGLSEYTSRKMPWKMIYVESHSSKRSALIRELKLKKCKSEYFEWLVLQPSNLLSQQ